MYYLKFCAVIAIQFAIIITSLISSSNTFNDITKAHESKDEEEIKVIEGTIASSMVMKMLLNFNQVLGIINSYNF